jgi:hypothetical protein
MNIIYLLPSEKKPAGGIKVILDHSQIINETKNKFNSSVLFIKKKKSTKWKNSLTKLINFKTNNYLGWRANEITVDKNITNQWFKSKINIKKTLNFDKKQDLVILPEIFAHFAKDLLIKKNINYAIFVQNGLALNFTSEHKILNEVYDKAKLIISVSSHIDRCIKKAFNINQSKILRINQSINSIKINFRSKSNLITYMPRKLPTHSNLVLFFLRIKLHKKWKILPIEDMSHENVVKTLKKSKIFLSFSNLEGFGLPPLEAASLGNLVVGYTGEGGKEYWKTPLFKKVEQGDILSFVSKIETTLNNQIDYKLIEYHRLVILKKYSHDNQIKKIIKMLNILKKYF